MESYNKPALLLAHISVSGGGRGRVVTGTRGDGKYAWMTKIQQLLLCTTSCFLQAGTQHNFHYLMLLHPAHMLTYGPLINKLG
jgi:hypothetical protein